MTCTKTTNGTSKLTDGAIAKRLGITAATLAYYRKRGCRAKSVAGVAAWREANVAKNGPPTLRDRAKGVRPKTEGDAGLSIEELRAKIRKLTAEAEERELKNAQRRGELYEADDVERDVAELTGMIRTRLESIPDELTQELPPEIRQTATQLWKDRINLILTAMAHWRLSSWDENESALAVPAEKEELHEDAE